jgi:acetyl-CoA acetyltransferase
LPAITKPRARVTADEARVIRAAHRAMDLRGRGKSGVHTTTDACRVIRELLDVLAAITGIDSANEPLPFEQHPDVAEVDAILKRHGITPDAIAEHIAAEQAGIAEGTVKPIRRR